MHRVVAVGALEPFKVWLRFENRKEGVVDLAEVFAQGGAFAPLSDPEAFAKVRVDPRLGAIVWPDDVDLDPDALYARLEAS